VSAHADDVVLAGPLSAVEAGHAGYCSGMQAAAGLTLDARSDRQTPTEGKTDRQMDRQSETDKQTDRQMDRQRDRQTDRQTDRRKGGKTDGPTSTRADARQHGILYGEYLGSGRAASSGRAGCGKRAGQAAWLDKAARRLLESRARESYQRLPDVRSASS
jgi:hypothetical protein